MKINEQTALLTPRVLLVPYSEHHVQTYHEWMKDPALQQATASEPLTLEQEYAMQRSWRADADKLTFIACVAPPQPLAGAVQGKVHDGPAAMIGDVNLFLTPDDDDEEGSEREEEQGSEEDGKAATPPERAPVVVVGEVEIMIAVATQRGKRHGRAVLSAFLAYIQKHLDAILAEYAAASLPCPPISAPRDGDDDEDRRTAAALKFLRVRIGADNVSSLRLFEAVGFAKLSEEPNYFGELELRLRVDERWGTGDADSVVERVYDLVG